MSRCLISFPSEAMAALTEQELEGASAVSHAVIEEAKAAGVYVFGGGIDEGVDPVRVAAVCRRPQELRVFGDDPAS